MIKLSLKQQIYIETIYELCQNHEHGHAHAKSISEKLGVRMASVTGVLRTLSDKDLINYQPRQAVTLTDNGFNIGKELAHSHSILADFFHDIMGCNKSRSERMACKIEHVIDPEFRHRLSEFACFLREHSSDENDLLAEFKRSYKKNVK
jgi:DtxR family transcriptional regulator, Mn-dependent transcriptional regulator